MRHIRQLEVAVAYQSTLLFGLLLCGVSQAQTACPPGMEEYGEGVCGYSQSEQPAPQAPEPRLPQLPKPPPQQWASRWVAIATDMKHAGAGAAVNQPSRGQAEQKALSECMSSGGSACKVEVAYDNECVAMVMGHPGYNVTTEATLEKATQSGMKNCSSAGNSNYHVYYSACSLPVRIQ